MKYLLIFLFFSVSVYAQQSAKKIEEKELRRHLEFLGSDLFEGRGTGTTGGELSAKYLALEFDKIGLKPARENNTFYQYIQMHGSIPLEQSQFRLFYNGFFQDLNLYNDYVLYETGEHTYLPLAVPIVFAGFGITDPQRNINDYENIDASGKIVLVFEGEPGETGIEFNTEFAYPAAKEKLAIANGAKGILIIPDINSAAEWKQISEAYRGEYVKLAYSPTGIFSAFINPRKLENFLHASNTSYPELKVKMEKNSYKTFPLKSKISFKGEYFRRDFTSSNVAGIIEGSDPVKNDSFIVVTAHYDHLGIGIPAEGDSVYNGVLDNALGCASLLEIAKSINSMDVKPARSILFLLTTAEEKGLLGSIYYLDHPLVPLNKTIANINLDGMAAFGVLDNIYGLGGGLSSLGYLLEESAQKYNLTVIKPDFNNDIPFFIKDFRQSDQFTFALRHIPSISVTEAFDKDNNDMQILNLYAKYYHTPKDDLNLDINYNTVLAHTELIMDLILRTCSAVNIPYWKKGSRFAD